MTPDTLTAVAQAPTWIWAGPALALLLCAAFFIFLGMIGFRFGVVKWGLGPGSLDRDGEDQRTSALTELGNVIDSIQKEQIRFKERQDTVRGDVKELKERQTELRERTLREFVRLPEMEEFVGRIEKNLGDKVDRLAITLESFLESCRKGECGAGRAAKGRRAA